LQVQKLGLRKSEKTYSVSKKLDLPENHECHCSVCAFGDSLFLLVMDKNENFKVVYAATLMVDPKKFGKDNLVVIPYEIGGSYNLSNWVYLCQCSRTELLITCSGQDSWYIVDPSIQPLTLNAMEPKIPSAKGFNSVPVRIGDGRLVVAGSWPPSTDITAIDPRAIEPFQKVGQIPYGPVACTSCTLVANRFLVGFGGKVRECIDKMFVYDTKTAKSSSIAKGGNWHPACQSAAVICKGLTIYIMGGSDCEDSHCIEVASLLPLILNEEMREEFRRHCAISKEEIKPPTRPVANPPVPAYIVDPSPTAMPPGPRTRVVPIAPVPIVGPMATTVSTMSALQLAAMVTTVPATPLPEGAPGSATTAHPTVVWQLPMIATPPESPGKTDKPQAPSRPEEREEPSADSETGDFWDSYSEDAEFPLPEQYLTEKLKKEKQEYEELRRRLKEAKARLKQEQEELQTIPELSRRVEQLRQTKGLLEASIRNLEVQEAGLLILPYPIVHLPLPLPSHRPRWGFSGSWSRALGRATRDHVNKVARQLENVENYRQRFGLLEKARNQELIARAILTQKRSDLEVTYLSTVIASAYSMVSLPKSSSDPRRSANGNEKKRLLTAKLLPMQAIFSTYRQDVRHLAIPGNKLKDDRALFACIENVTRKNIRARQLEETLRKNAPPFVQPLRQFWEATDPLRQEALFRGGQRMTVQRKAWRGFIQAARGDLDISSAIDLIIKEYRLLQPRDRRREG